MGKIKSLLKNLVICCILVITGIIIYVKLHISLSLSDFNYRNNLYLYTYGFLVTSATFFVFYVSSFKYKDLYIESKNKVANNETKPLVSCILAVYNEELIIRKCVESLLNSTYENKEIIVVNDCSTDQTKHILEEYKAKVIIINLSKNVGKKKAIVEGIKISKGSIFAFTDSDTVVEKEAIAQSIEIFRNYPNVGGASGHVGALNAQENILTKIQDSWYETQFSVKKATESVYGAVTCVSGPLALFRKEAIYNYIPAWENDEFLGSEFKFATDRTLTGFVIGSKYIGKGLKKKYENSSFVKEVNYPERDWDVVYCKSAKAFTVVPNTLDKLIKQNIRWKKSFIRNLFFTGGFYWRKNPMIVCKYYSGIIFTIIGPLIAIRHIIYLPFYGNFGSAILYLGGIVAIGSFYAIMAKINNPKSNTWMYRPVMSLISTLLISWLLIYAIMTMKKSVWYRN